MSFWRDSFQRTSPSPSFCLPFCLSVCLLVKSSARSLQVDRHTDVCVETRQDECLYTTRHHTRLDECLYTTRYHTTLDKTSVSTPPDTANPTWCDIFESSKLKARTSLLPRFSAKRRLSFELRALKQHSKMSPQVGLAVPHSTRRVSLHHQIPRSESQNKHSYAYRLRASTGTRSLERNVSVPIHLELPRELLTRLANHTVH